MKYAIADRLTPEARAYAASWEYVPWTENDPRPRAQVPYVGPHCPLGLALRYLGVTNVATPPSNIVAWSLCAAGTSQNNPVWQAIRDEAFVFINDWDARHITDLADALGVEPI